MTAARKTEPGRPTSEEREEIKTLRKEVFERSKLSPSRLRRYAFVYVRQSTQAQPDRDVESTDRQYALVARAVDLGFARERVVVIDEDLGVSGSGGSSVRGSRGSRQTSGSARGTGARIGGVSRLARNNADWCRLLHLCGVARCCCIPTRRSVAACGKVF